LITGEEKEVENVWLLFGVPFCGQFGGVEMNVSSIIRRLLLGI
jgi:hypothetical protein